MAINKVTFGDTTLIDLSISTLSDASELVSGVTAYDRSGNLITGTFTGTEWTSGVYQDSENYIKISPNAAAGGISQDGEYIELYSTQPGDFTTTTKTITANGTYTAADDNAYGYSSVTVCISDSPTLQTKTATPTTSQQLIEPDSGYDGLSSVTVNAIPSEYIVPSGTKSITINSNGTTSETVTSYETVSITVSVPSGTPSLQAKSVSPTESQQVISADNGYDGLSSVTVAAISSTYVGSGITRRNSLSVSGKTVTANAGYYASAVSETVTVSNQAKSATPTESQQVIEPDSQYDGLSSVTVAAISSTYVGSGITRNPSLTVNGNTVTAPVGYYSTAGSASVATATQATPTISVSNAGLITASATQTAGYVSAGTKSATQQMTTQAATTVTPSTTSQTVGAAGRYMTGAITVSAIPSNYKDTSDATATAADINSGATAYVNGSKITGSQVIQHYYTGSSAPSSSTGVNGDIYLQTGA